MKRVLWVFLGVLVLLVATTNAWAQATAQINGTVADSSGGVLPGVTVVAIQTETGFRREVVSDENGAYSLLNLPIGPYRIEASLQGFRTFSQTGVVLQVNSNPVVPVRLELGNLEETVSVEASAPQTLGFQLLQQKCVDRSSDQYLVSNRRNRGSLRWLK
jgi:hypothetical protein